jgi:DnaJ family protein B protein 12
MSSVNKEEAIRCLEISKKHFRSGNKEKAVKFAKKSISLYSTNEGKSWLEIISVENTEIKETFEKVETSAREYTEEQEEAVKEIKKRGDDYYKILGVEKTATDVEIKKSYRKLALQFHPDKNAAPGAPEAFKKIGNAFSTLSDPNLRESYDLYGPKVSSGVRETPFAQFHQTHVTPEEIFNMFFSGLGDEGSFNGTSFEIGIDGRPRIRRMRTRRRRSSDNEEMGAGFLVNLFQWLPLILLILYYSMSWSSAYPEYSFTHSAVYNSFRETGNRKVFYYVNSREFSPIEKNPSKLRSFENRVESEFIRHLQEECLSETKQKERQISRARWWGSNEQLEAAQNQKLPYCEKLYKFER